MPKIRNVSGVDRTIANGRLVRADEVVDVPDDTNYVTQADNWEAVEETPRKHEHKKELS